MLGTGKGGSRPVASRDAVAMHCVPCFCRLAVLALGLMLLIAPAAAERRVALVIGNSAYEHTNPLPNPHNDATDISAALERLGFEVIGSGVDLDKRSLERKIREFTSTLAGADVALFFYAG